MELLRTFTNGVKEYGVKEHKDCIENIVLEALNGNTISGLYVNEVYPNGDMLVTTGSGSYGVLDKNLQFKIYPHSPLLYDYEKILTHYELIKSQPFQTLPNRIEVYKSEGKFKFILPDDYGLLHYQIRSYTIDIYGIVVIRTIDGLSGIINEGRLVALPEYKSLSDFVQLHPEHPSLYSISIDKYNRIELINQKGQVLFNNCDDISFEDDSIIVTERGGKVEKYNHNKMKIIDKYWD